MLIFAGECSEGVCDKTVCQYGGVCKVTSADSHVCLCPIGRGGENCQHGRLNMEKRAIRMGIQLKQERVTAICIGLFK